jgi:hypothetical protein
MYGFADEFGASGNRLRLMNNLGEQIVRLINGLG